MNHKDRAQAYANQRGITLTDIGWGLPNCTPRQRRRLQKKYIRYIKRIIRGC